MSFIDDVRRAKALLREEERVSLRALRRDLGLDDDALEELVAELIDVQGVAAREGSVLRWAGEAPRRSAPARHAHDTPVDAERRQLTVLFCDLVDSTRLSAAMDAEEWGELTRSYQESVSTIVDRFHGYVAQYQGDGIVVYFGYPQAHEDDAERAVRAGLQIVEELSVEVPEKARTEAVRETLHSPAASRLEVRVGVHTGPVVVGEIGLGRREALALGETTNIAARLQGIAEAGSVVLSGATLRLVQGIFRTEDLGAQTLKDIATPVRALRALSPTGLRSRLDVAAGSSLTPLVGREQELMLLEDRWQQVCEGRGQAVLVSGEAGIGKSRLVQAFRGRLAEQPHTWLEGRASPYTQDSPLYPVLELNRLVLGFQIGDPMEEKLARLEAGLAAAGFDLAGTLPPLAALHGVELPQGRYPMPTLSPEGLRKKTLSLLAEWLVRLGRLQPVVLLAEDLHWMDPSTLELMSLILDQAPTERVLMLWTYRPDFTPPWGAKSHLTPMLLSRLTRVQVVDLIRKAARGRTLPDAWVEEIMRRSDGVPLFAEELTRAALESRFEDRGDAHAVEPHIPETLQDSLMARLDALGPVKELAQVASVLGREFDYDLLAKVSPMKEADLAPALAVAVREELFYQRGAPPDATYYFKHALIRDAAYGSLLRATLRRHHGRVADALIHRSPEIAETQPELVAHHLAEAGDAQAAIGWWERAGQRALQRSAAVEAARHMSRALDALATVPADPARNERELGMRTLHGVALMAAEGYASAAVERTFARAQQLCQAVGETPLLFPTLFGLWAFHFVRADRGETVEHLGNLARLAERTGDDAQRLVSFMARAMTLYYSAKYDEAIVSAEMALAIYDPVRDATLAFVTGQDPGVYAHVAAGTSLWHLGYPDRALGRVAEAIELAERVAHPFSLCGALSLMTLMRLERREPDECQATARYLSQIAGEQGFPMWQSLAGVYSALATLHRGDENAWKALEEGLARYQAIGSGLAIPELYAELAGLACRACDFESGLRNVEQAAARVRTALDVIWAPEVERVRGEILRACDGPEAEVRACFARALAIAREQKSRSLELRAATSLARLQRDLNEREPARALLAPIYDWFTEAFDTQDLKDAKALLEELGS